MKPPVVVLGATGQVGLFAVLGLLEAGREVVALTRQDPGEQPVAIRRLTPCGRARLRDCLGERMHSNGFALLSCGPIDLARELLDSDFSGAGCGLERVVAIGTTSTEVKRQSADPLERRIVGEIEGALADIRQRCKSSNVPLTILNPTLIYGCGLDQNLTRVLHWIRRTGFAPLSANARGRRQPLHVEDLAATIVRAVESSPAHGLETAVAGGEVIEYEEMIGRLFDATGRTRRFMRLAEFWFAPIAALSRVLPGVGRISSETFRRQSRDQVFDDGPARQILGHAPRPFRPLGADFELPPSVDHIRQALTLM